MPQQRLLRSPLARMLVLAMIGVSSLIALVITAAQLYTEYRREVGAIDAHFAIIEQSYLQSIEETTWLLDMARLHLLLAGIARLPDFRYAEISSGGRILAGGGARAQDALLERRFPLRYAYRDRLVDIGTLTVGASLGAVQRRLWERAGFILAANALKTFLVAFFMLWLVRHLVVKRLENIAAHAAHLGEGRAWTPLAESGAAGSRGDEVGVLVATLNRMAARLAETFSALERQVREKDVLLQEIYHRVKNNLQVVASLLNMQGRQVADAGMKELLAESANRVKSMALVHEQLYRSGDLSNISLAEYLKQLIEYIAHAHQPLSARVPVRLEAAGLKLGIETAVPLGLMVNELVSNAYKHGYGPQAARGEIVLRMEALEDGRVRLEVMDDGRGLPEGFDPKAASSLGLQLVLTLAQQLGGELRHASSAGRTSFEVLFRPEAREAERRMA